MDQEQTISRRLASRLTALNSRVHNDYHLNVNSAPILDGEPENQNYEEDADWLLLLLLSEMCSYVKWNLNSI